MATNQELVNQRPLKLACVAASTANVDESSAPATIDGVTLAAGDRVLLKDQTAGAENGVWVFAAAASAMTRDANFDVGGATREVMSGLLVVVGSEGTVNGPSVWQLATDDPITVGTTALTFTKLKQDGGTDADLIFTASTRVEIASGAAALTQAVHTIDGEGDAADTLVTITGPVAGEVFFLRPDDAAGAPITVQHGTAADEIVCPAGQDIVLNDANDVLMLQHNGTLSTVLAHTTVDALLTADAAGRAKMADDYFTTAEFVAGAGGKFAPDCIDNTAVQNIFAADAFGADADSRGAFVTDFIDATTADDIIATGALGEDLLTANELTARVAANVALGATTAGLLCVHPVTVGGGADSNASVTIDHKFRVVKCRFQPNAAPTAGSDVLFDDGSTWIGASSAAGAVIDISGGTDAQPFDATHINDATQEVAASGTLRVVWTSTGGDFLAGVAYFEGYRVT